MTCSTYDRLTVFRCRMLCVVTVKEDLLKPNPLEHHDEFILVIPSHVECVESGSRELTIDMEFIAPFFHEGLIETCCLVFSWCHISIKRAFSLPS